MGSFVNFGLSLQFFTLIVVECSCAAKDYYNGSSQFFVLLVSNLKSLDLRVREFYVNGLVWYFTLSPWLLSNFLFHFDLVSGLFVGRLFIHIDLLWK